jgi:hypothetical protein
VEEDAITADSGGRLFAGIAGSKFAGGMDVCLLCLFLALSCVGRGHFDELISRPKESYSVSYKIQKPKKGIRKRR